jgi:hypothetical protein
VFFYHQSLFTLHIRTSGCSQGHACSAPDVLTPVALPQVHARHILLQRRAAGGGVGLRSSHREKARKNCDARSSKDKGQFRTLLFRTDFLCVSFFV